MRAEAAAAAAWDPALSEPVRKGGFPRWVWIGCGCGCLFVFLLALAAGIGSWLLFKDVDDPEVQWPRLREVLYFEERPQDLELDIGIKILSHYQEYRLHDAEDGYSAIVRTTSDMNQISALMDPEASGPGVSVTGGERLEWEIQGREVDALRFDAIDEEVPFLGADARSELDQGPGLRFRIVRDDMAVVVELRSGPDGEAVSDEVIDDFFEHFDVWR